MDAGSIIKAAIVGSAMLIGLASTWLLKMPKDNPVEQIAETIMEEESGVKIDLTPE